jgi:hypothetical protein
MLEDHGFCGHGPHTAGTEKPRQGDEQMDPQNNKIAHASNRTTLKIQPWGIAGRRGPELSLRIRIPQVYLVQCRATTLLCTRARRIARYESPARARVGYV